MLKHVVVRDSGWFCLIHRLLKGLLLFTVPIHCVFLIRVNETGWNPLTLLEFLWYQLMGSNKVEQKGTLKKPLDKTSVMMIKSHSVLRKNYVTMMSRIFVAYSTNQLSECIICWITDCWTAQRQWEDPVKSRGAAQWRRHRDQEDQKGESWLLWCSAVWKEWPMWSWSRKNTKQCGGERREGFWQSLIWSRFLNTTASLGTFWFDF